MEILGRSAFAATDSGIADADSVSATSRVRPSTAPVSDSKPKAFATPSRTLDLPEPAVPSTATMEFSRRHL